MVYGCSGLGGVWGDTNYDESVDCLRYSVLGNPFLFSTQQANRVVMGARKIYQIESTLLDWKAGALPVALFDEIVSVIQ